MKQFDRIFVLFVAAYIMTAVMTAVIIRSDDMNNNRGYVTEVNRIMSVITNPEDIDNLVFSSYPRVMSAGYIKADELTDAFMHTNSEYEKIYKIYMNGQENICSLLPVRGSPEMKEYL